MENKKIKSVWYQKYKKEKEPVKSEKIPGFSKILHGKNLRCEVTGTSDIVNVELDGQIHGDFFTKGDSVKIIYQLKKGVKKDDAVICEDWTYYRSSNIYNIKETGGVERVYCSPVQVTKT